jgi:hypothetical protein
MLRTSVEVDLISVEQSPSLNFKVISGLAWDRIKLFPRIPKEFLEPQIPNSRPSLGESICNA